MTDKRSLYVLRYDQSPSQPLLVSSRGEASATTLFQRRRLRQNMSGLKIPSFSRKNINNDGRMILYLIETTKAKLKRFHTNFASASMWKDCSVTPKVTQYKIKVADLLEITTRNRLAFQRVHSTMALERRMDWTEWFLALFLRRIPGEPRVSMVYCSFFRNRAHLFDAFRGFWGQEWIQEGRGWGLFASPFWGTIVLTGLSLIPTLPLPYPLLLEYSQICNYSLTNLDCHLTSPWYAYEDRLLNFSRSSYYKL